MVFDDRWPLDEELREMLANRAIDCLCQIESPRGHLAYVLFLKGQACRASGQHSAAVEYLQQAVELNPENLHTLLALAWCFKRLHQLDQAIEAMVSAVELEPNSAISHYNLACYWALAGDELKAIESLQTALELNPDYRENIANEDDFDSIRNSDRFVAAFGLLI